MAEDNKQLPIVEIVTGVIIAIILIVFALPRLMNWSEGSPIDDEATDLYYNLERAKTTAIQNKHKVWVLFQKASEYSIFEDVNGNGRADKNEPSRRIRLRKNVQFGSNATPPLDNVWGSEAISKPIEIMGGDNKLYFNSAGQGSANGAVYFMSKKDVGVSNNNLRAVRILKTSGEIKVLRSSPDDAPPWK